MGNPEATLRAGQAEAFYAESYTLGQLGQVYEPTGQWSEAPQLTETALALVRKILAPEIAYQWQGRLERILCQGKITWADGYLP